MELCHSKAFTDKTRTESPALHWQWQWQNTSAQTRPQVQAPLGILPYVADLTAHSTLLIQRTTHFSKAFSTLFWDSFKSDKTHQDTPTPWLTLQRAELPFHAKHLKNLHWSCESLKLHLCTAQPMFWQEQFRQDFRALSNAFTTLRRIVQRTAITCPDHTRLLHP